MRLGISSDVCFEVKGMSPSRSEGLAIEKPEAKKEEERRRRGESSSGSGYKMSWRESRAPELSVEPSLCSMLRVPGV